MVYDLIIIGAGPAGMAASIYASRYKVNHLLLGEIPGGLMAEAHKVCNFPSENEINGFDLMMKMKGHVEHLGGQITAGKVVGIKKSDGHFMVETETKETSEAKSILLATGTIHRQLGLPNEKQFVGHGLSYCATCDAMFYKNKTVAVAGGGNSALTAALYLADIADKVYQIVRKDTLKGETVWADQVKNNPKIELIFNSNITELIGEGSLTGIKLDSREDVLPVAGLFVEIGSAPETALFGDLNLEIDNNGYIAVERNQATSVPGVWAAGDITNSSNGLRQIVTACAEGAVAAGDIFRYLQSAK